MDGWLESSGQTHLSLPLLYWPCQPPQSMLIPPPEHSLKFNPHLLISILHSPLAHYNSPTEPLLKQPIMVSSNRKTKQQQFQAPVRKIAPPHPPKPLFTNPKPPPPFPCNLLRIGKTKPTPLLLYQNRGKRNQTKTLTPSSFPCWENNTKPSLPNPSPTPNHQTLPPLLLSPL